MEAAPGDWFRRLREAWKGGKGGAVALAQLCAVLNAATGVCSAALARRGVRVPAVQCFLNYVLLGLAFGPAAWARRREGALATSRRAAALALLAAVDVEANYTIVLAFRYTSITSVTLLDCAAVPFSMALSWAALRLRYGRGHVAGMLLAVAGLVLLTLSDAEASSPSAGTRPLLGDLLTVLAALLYATSNVVQEGVLREAAFEDVLGALGVLGSALSGLQVALLEREQVRVLLASASWGTAAELGGFALALFAFYALVPAVLTRAGATHLNLSLLATDVWVAGARAAFFGGFGGLQAFGAFVGAFAAVVGGLVVFCAAGNPRRAGDATAAARYERIDQPSDRELAPRDQVEGP